MIHIFLLWIPDIDLALARIKERVASGGHNVPAKDVRRRFTRSSNHFVNNYKPLADYWSILDNSVVPPALIGKGEADTIEIYNQAVYNDILERKAV